MDLDDPDGAQAEARIVIQERVVEDDHVALRGRDRIDLAPRARNERDELHVVGRGIAPIDRGMRRIGGDERVTYFANVDAREFGVHPQMRIVVAHREAVGTHDDR
jgi:hypothetical protein